MIVKENINFERGTEPKDAMGSGLWKPYKDILMLLWEYKENGGVLTKGRELYFPESGKLMGYWLEFDEKQHVDLMYGNGFNSKQVPSYARVKVPTKVMYV